MTWGDAAAEQIVGENATDLEALKGGECNLVEHHACYHAYYGSWASRLSFFSALHIRYYP